MDRILNAIAALLLDQLGATAARIDQGGVDAKFGGIGSVRIEVRRQ